MPLLTIADEITYGERLEETLTLLVALEDEEPDVLTVVLSTCGGSESAGRAILAGIRRLRALGWTVRTRGLGQVSSAGIAMLAAGSPGERLLDRTAWVCMHLGTVDGEFDQTELRPWSDHVLRNIEQYYEILAELSGKPIEVWRRLLEDGRDHWLRPEEVLAYGLVDALI